ncbi:MAG: response regulator [Myxococcota bacterium]
MERVLVVDTNSASRALLERRLQRLNFEVVVCTAQADALELHRELNPDCIVLDGDCLDRTINPLLDDLRKHISGGMLFSVILQTASRSSAHDATLLGIPHVLVKPYRQNALQAAIQTVFEHKRSRSALEERVGASEEVFGMMDEGTFRFRTLDQARGLALMLAGLAEDGERTYTGLWELLVNAVEHGNLGITYEQKSELLASGNWEAEVGHRLADPKYRHREVQVSLRRHRDQLVFTVKDAGTGFDFRPHLDFAPERALDAHGRGIAVAKHFCFSGLEYRGAGNEVVAWVGARMSRQVSESHLAPAEARSLAV